MFRSRGKALALNRALTRLDAIPVLPGAVGAWRRAALDTVGGYPGDALSEDRDLTFAIRGPGWARRSGAACPCAW